MSSVVLTSSTMQHAILDRSSICHSRPWEALKVHNNYPHILTVGPFRVASVLWTLESGFWRSKRTNSALKVTVLELHLLMNLPQEM